MPCSKVYDPHDVLCHQLNGNLGGWPNVRWRIVCWTIGWSRSEHENEIVIWRGDACIFWHMTSQRWQLRTSCPTTNKCKHLRKKADSWRTTLRPSICRQVSITSKRLVRSLRRNQALGLGFGHQPMIINWDIGCDRNPRQGFNPATLPEVTGASGVSWQVLVPCVDGTSSLVPARGA